MKRQKIDKLILILCEAKHLAVQLNRWRTFNKIDDAISEAGWELADILSGKQYVGSKKFNR